MVKKYRCTFNTARIKRQYSYSVSEICELLHVHKNTVRHWLRSGLSRIDNKCPYLIHGSTLIAFLDKRQQARKTLLAENEFYCFRCKSPTLAWERIIDITLHTEKIVNIQGICERCECAINRNISLKKLPRIAELFIIQQVHNPHIIATLHPSLTCYLQKETHL